MQVEKSHMKVTSSLKTAAIALSVAAATQVQAAGTTPEAVRRCRTTRPLPTAC